MEQFKNLMLVMIWAHNRMDIEALRYMQLDINNSLEKGLITFNQLTLLNQARTLYENDCYEQMRKKQEEAAHASMAGVLPDRQGDRGYLNARMEERKEES